MQTTIRGGDCSFSNRCQAVYVSQSNPCVGDIGEELPDLSFYSACVQENLQLGSLVFGVSPV